MPVIKLVTLPVEFFTNRTISSPVYYLVF
jgi:hypothetical protein